MRFRSESGRLQGGRGLERCGGAESILALTRRKDIATGIALGPGSRTMRRRAFVIHVQGALSIPRSTRHFEWGGGSSGSALEADARSFICNFRCISVAYYESESLACYLFRYFLRTFHPSDSDNGNHPLSLPSSTSALLQAYQSMS